MGNKKPRQSITRISGTRNQWRVTTTSGSGSSHSQSSKVVRGRNTADRTASRQMAHHKARRAAGTSEW